MNFTKPKKLSIIIPCYNEENSIERILNEISLIQFENIEKEIIVVDDFSKDNTRSILDSIKDKYKIKLILKEFNSGKTDTVKLGIENSTGDLVIIQDADLEYDPKDYQRLIRPFEVGQADVVYGSRFVGDSPRKSIYKANYYANKFMTFLSRILGGVRVTDIHTCYIMMKGDLARDIGKKITSKKFGFNPEIAARLGKIKSIRVYETGISYYGRTKAEGKKIKLSDGIQAIKDIIYYNLFVK